MTLRARLVVVVVLGIALGAVDAATNAIASPYTDIGASLVGTPWQAVAAFAGLILNAGWAWAALAVAAGWFAGRRPGRRGAVAVAATGVAALFGAIVAYFVVDSALKGDQLVGHAGEIAVWGVLAVLLCSPLALLGAQARRTDWIGLPAGLVVPAGAALQMILIPPGYGGISLRPWAEQARATVLVAAAVAALLVVAAFVVRRRRRVSPPRTAAASPATRSA